MIKKKEFFIVFLILSFPFSSLVAGSIQPNLPIGMDFNDAEAPHVFKVISTVSDIHFILDEELAGKRIFVTAYDTTIREAIEKICSENGLASIEGPYYIWIGPIEKRMEMEAEFERTWKNFECLSTDYRLSPVSSAVRELFKDLKVNVSCPRCDSRERPAVSRHFRDILYADIHRCLKKLESLPLLNSPLRTSCRRELRKRLSMADYFQVRLEPVFDKYRE